MATTALSIAIFLMRVAALVVFLNLVFHLRPQRWSRLGRFVLALAVVTMSIVVFRQASEVWSVGWASLADTIPMNALGLVQRTASTCLMLGAAVYLRRVFGTYERDVEWMQANQEQLAGDLIESERLHQSFVEYMPIPCCTFDADGTLLTWNRAAESVYGFSAEETVGAVCFEMMVPSNRAEMFRQAIDKVFGGEFLMDVVWRDRGRGDQAGWRRGNLFPLLRQDGSVRCGIAMWIDITQQKTAEDEASREQELMRQLYELQEQERQTLANDLHDGLIQYLVGAKLQIDAYLVGREPTNGDEFSTLREAGRDLQLAMSEGRQMVAGLRPLIIDDEGVVAAIEHLINEDVGEDSLEISFEHDVTFDRLEPMIETTLFRIVQESLTNVRRHSASKQATVSLSNTEDAIRLEVADGGKGFDVAELPGGRYGVRGIRERARLFGGKASIESAPGEGTRVAVDLPLRLSSDGRKSA